MRRAPLFLLGAMAATVAAFAPTLHAQPSPPMRLYGSLTIDGNPAPANTRVRGFVNGVDCTTTNVFQTPAGQYAVEVAGQSQIPGCGADGVTVNLRVDARDAFPTTVFATGQFQRLDITVSNAPPPSPEPPPAPTPAPGLPPAPTPTPAPGPSPVPQPGRGFSVARLPLNSPCVPAEGQARCDTTRALLWAGDLTSWQAEAARRGLPRPSAADAASLANDLRVAAYDPAATIALARQNGWPKIYLSALRFRGILEGEADEYVEVSNFGGGDQDMSGWRVRATESGVDFYFTEGTILQAGAACRFYTNQIRDDSCPGSIFVSQTGVWPDSTGTAELWYDPLSLLADITSYNADPDTQPAPPNLQGVTDAAG